MDYNYLSKNLLAITKRLPSHARLIVVSKNQPVEKIIPLLELGHREFGENRMQDVKDKFTPLKKSYPDIHLHFIGHLQTNKVKDAVAFCDVIHTVDRTSLAQALATEMQRSGKYPDCLVQVNTGDEVQKSGISLQDAESFTLTCRDILRLPIKGLMCIPPAHEAPAKHFALLRDMAACTKLELLSMGMSNDYEVALQHGATHIRVGRSIFEEN